VEETFVMEAFDSVSTPLIFISGMGESTIVSLKVAVIVNTSFNL